MCGSTANSLYTKLAQLFVVSSFLLGSLSFAECDPASQLEYRVLDRKPHSVESFTQGLVFVDEDLWESIGGYGDSALIRHAADGSQERVRLPAHLFAEGLTWFQDKLWQLSWQAGLMRIYQISPLELQKSLRYSGEGWGLTTDGQHLFKSDGSDRIDILRGEDLRRVRSLKVRHGNKPIRRLNELEWWQDSILANIWQSNNIAQISAETGCVLAWLDLRQLWPHSERNPEADVLNGIAVHPRSGHVWVTGKRWRWLFELELKLPPAQ